MNQKPVAWIIQSKYGTPTIVWNGEPIKYTSNIVKQDDIPLYTTPQYRELSDEEIIESLAELEHEQWMSWAKTLYEKEPLLSLERRQRWHDCFKPYTELSEEMKEHDRVWARKALAILKKASEK